MLKPGVNEVDYERLIMNRCPSKPINLRKSRIKRWFLIVLMVVLFVISYRLILTDSIEPLERIENVNGQLLNRKLLAIDENHWVKIYPQETKLLQTLLFMTPADTELDWHRQEHAGLAFDAKAKSLLIFGSNTHGEDWDNRVHEFNLLSLKWVEHYTASAKESYRADTKKNAIAGEDGLFPWAMHSYDNIAYIPEMDALVVTADFNHTPQPTRQATQAKLSPTWIYDLNTRNWTILEQEHTPSFFASGSTYDPISSSLWAYKKGSLWQFNIREQLWRKVPGEHKTDLAMHFTMTTDIHRHQLVFFCNSNKSASIWVYTPGLWPDQEGTWEEKQPGGDTCPKDQHFPVAYDKQQGVFLLMPDESDTTSATLVYSPDTNKYIRVKGAQMSANGMNYMMAYDPYHRLFLLVTGDKHTPFNVWAFRLNMKTLNL